jgi:hypothetical protein
MGDLTQKKVCSTRDHVEAVLPPFQLKGLQDRQADLPGRTDCQGHKGYNQEKEGKMCRVATRQSSGVGVTIRAVALKSGYPESQESATADISPVVHGPARGATTAQICRGQFAESILWSCKEFRVEPFFFFFGILIN